MERFYFNIRDQRGFVEDEEGSEHPDIEHALEEAKASARDLAKQFIDDKVSTGGHCIEICNEEGQILAVVTVAEVLEHPRHPKFEQECQSPLH